MQTVENIREIFTGEYRLERQVYGSKTFTCSGIAAMQPLSEYKIAYEETGHCYLERKQRFYQKRTFEIDEKHLYIYTAQNTLLHQFDLTAEVLEHVHHCKHDKYAIKIMLLDAHAFQMIYEVTGPYKNYRTVSYFSRASTLNPPF